MASESSCMFALVKMHSGVQCLEIARPNIGTDLDVMLKPVRVGLCRTDLNVAWGRTHCEPPRVLGHEVAGVISAIGARVTRIRVGDRVAVNPLLPCGVCSECARARQCPTPRMLGVDLDGGFAQALVVPEQAAHRVPDSMSFERAAYVEPVAATLAVLDSPIARDARGLVLGTGRIAELTKRILFVRGFRSVLTHPVAPAPEARSFDWVIDTVGSSASLETAMRSLRQGGMLVLKSRPATPIALDVSFAVQRELSFYAVRYAPFSDAIELLSAAAFIVEDLFGQTHPLSAFEQVFSQAGASETSKVFFAPNAEFP
jgi:threonine dehydrogenase-like Zn-dependent dehydrogenase